jgi:hypothetical protein
MMAKPSAHIVLAGTRADAPSADSQQVAGEIEVTALRKPEDAPKRDNSPRSSFPNPSVDNGMQSLNAKTTPSISRNRLPANELRASECGDGRQNTRKNVREQTAGKFFCDGGVSILSAEMRLRLSGARGRISGEQRVGV